MTVTVNKLIAAKDAETIQTTQYISTGVKTIIDKFTATNTTALTATLSVNLVASGGSTSSTNLIVNMHRIAPSDTYDFPELIGQVLESGDFISTIASATGLTITASGRQIT